MNHELSPYVVNATPRALVIRDQADTAHPEPRTHTGSLPSRPHPTDNTNLYSNYGCRCANCRAAWAAYNRKRRAERAAPDVLKKHGLDSTYLNYACRCEECRAAHAAHGRARSAS